MSQIEINYLNNSKIAKSKDLLEMYFLCDNVIDNQFYDKVSTHELKDVSANATHIYKKHSGISIELLNEIFRVFNDPEENPLLSPIYQLYLRELKTHTSMSIGDFISIDGHEFQVCSIGWKKRVRGSLNEFDR